MLTLKCDPSIYPRIILRHEEPIQYCDRYRFIIRLSRVATREFGEVRSDQQLKISPCTLKHDGGDCSDYKAHDNKLVATHVRPINQPMCPTIAISGGMVERKRRAFDEKLRRGGDHGRTRAHVARMLLRLEAAIEESRFSRLSGGEAQSWRGEGRFE
ncbi:hypothetical protein Dimus_035355, partial [Dionaea muscipula]